MPGRRKPESHASVKKLTDAVLVQMTSLRLQNTDAVITQMCLGVCVCVFERRINDIFVVTNQLLQSAEKEMNQALVAKR